MNRNNGLRQKSTALFQLWAHRRRSSMQNARADVSSTECSSAECRAPRSFKLHDLSTRQLRCAAAAAFYLYSRSPRTRFEKDSPRKQNIREAMARIMHAPPQRFAPYDRQFDTHCRSAFLRTSRSSFCTWGRMYITRSSALALC